MTRKLFVHCFIALFLFSLSLESKSALTTPRPQASNPHFMLVASIAAPGGTTNGDILRFNGSGTGPLSSISSIPQSELDGPGWMVFNGKGELFVGNRHGNVAGSGQGSVRRFLMDSSGNFTPNGQITGNGIEAVHGLDFAPDGELFVASLYSGRVSRFVFDSAGDASPNGSFVTGSLIAGVAFAPDGELFTTHFSQIKRWKKDATGAMVPNGTIGGFGGMHGLRFSPEGELFVTSMSENRVYRISFNASGTASITGAISVPGGPIDVRFSPTGEFFVSSHQTGGIHRFTFDSSGNAVSNGSIVTDHLAGLAIADVCTFQPPKFLVAAAIAAPGGTTNGDILRFDGAGTDPLSPISSIPQSELDGPGWMVFSAEGELFVGNRHGNVAGSGQGSVRRFLMDLSGNFTPNGQITDNGLEAVHGLDFAPDGELFVASLYSGRVSRFVFDSAGNAISNGSFLTGSIIAGVAFAPDGELFTTHFSHIKRWKKDAAGNMAPNGTIGGFGGMHGLRFSTEGELFVTSMSGNRVYRISFDSSGTASVTGSLSVPGGPIDVRFSPTGELFVSSHQTGGIHRFTFDTSGNAVSNGSIVTDHLAGLAILSHCPPEAAPVNQPPVATSGTVAMDEDTQAIITLTGSDADGDPLEAWVTSLPAVGSLQQFTGEAINAEDTLVTDSLRRVIYVPPTNAFEDPLAAIEFVLRDPAGNVSDPAVISIFVNAVNDMPVAEAGSGQTRECAGPSGSPVVLDGSASSDIEGDPLVYTWTGPFPEGGGTVSGVSPTVTLAHVGPGPTVHTITLVVSDGEFSSIPDTVEITVADSQAPTIEPPPDTIWPQSVPVVLGSPVVSDVCDASPAVTNDAPLSFPLGTTVVTWTATDVSGHSATALQNVTLIDAPIGDGVTIGPGLILGQNVTIEDDVAIGQNVTIEDDVILKKGASVGDGTTIGADARIEKDAEIGSNVTIGENATVKKDAVIGDGTQIGPGARIDNGAMIGDGAQINENARVKSGAVLGDRIFLGEDAQVESGASVGDDVCISRGASIKTGVVIGNRVRIGSFATIGAGAVIWGPIFAHHETWIGDGSTVKAEAVVGANSRVGHMVIIAPGVTVGESVTIGNGESINSDLPDGSRVGGEPSVPSKL